MNCWQIREVCGPGKEGRLFTLNKDQPLTVGQSNECTIQLKLGSVERRHAVVEWNSKKLSYIVRDLGSTSGTFINNAPLTKGTEELKHGDSLRFGYERSHVFRVEENFQKSVKSVSPTLHPLPTSTATQTSPQTNVQQSTSQAPPPAPTPSPAQLPLVLPQGVLLPPGGYFVSGGQQGAILTPGGQIQYILPPAQGLLTSSAPSLPVTPQPLLLTTSQSATPPPPPETTPTTIQVQDIETESLIDDFPVSPVRTDGRRQVDLSTTPGLAITSRLYGQPSWWGEEPERPHPHSDPEFKHGTPRGQVLRDLDSDETSSVSSTPSRSSKLSVKDELRLKAITNSASSELSSSNTSWVVDFGTTPKPRHSKPRPRSADPSPVRAPPVEKRQVSSATPSRPRSTVVTQSESASRHARSKTVTKRPTGSSSLTRSASARRTTPGSPQRASRSSLDSTTRKKSGSASDITKTTSSTADKARTKSGTKGSADVKRSGLDSKTRRRSGSTPAVSVKSPSHSIVEKTYTKIGGQGSSDELQTSLSDLSLTSLAEPVVVKGGGLTSASESCVGGEDVRVCTGEEGKGGSARKKWMKEQSQPPDALMLANIEARMRQLSKLAQGAALKLLTVRRELEEVGVVKRDEHPHIVPFSLGEQNVPQWKFSQTKEAHGIFRSIKSVEKWLTDINSTVSSMQLSPQGGGAEGVDYEATEGELEYYHDSIEDNFASCSESYGSD